MCFYFHRKIQHMVQSVVSMFGRVLLVYMDGNISNLATQKLNSTYVRESQVLSRFTYFKYLKQIHRLWLHLTLVGALSVFL
jgi:hypothetical protein